MDTHAKPARLSQPGRHIDLAAALLMLALAPGCTFEREDDFFDPGSPGPGDEGPGLETEGDTDPEDGDSGPGDDEWDTSEGTDGDPGDDTSDDPGEPDDPDDPGDPGADPIDPKFTCTYKGYGYLTADELCEYINFQRVVYQYDSGCVAPPLWPIQLEIDAAASAIAQAEAERLADGGGPQGEHWCDTSPCPPDGGVQDMWIANIAPESMGDEFMSADLMFTAHDLNTNSNDCNLIPRWTLARLGLFHYHPCEGPIATKMGCGAAVSADGERVWRVVKMAP